MSSSRTPLPYASVMKPTRSACALIRSKPSALLLFGFAGALRRSELVALQVEDVALAAGGLRVRIPRSKTDPAGQGAEIGLPRGGIYRA